MWETGITTGLLRTCRAPAADDADAESAKRRERMLVVCCLLMQALGTLGVMAIAGMPYYSKYTGDLHLYIESSRKLLQGYLPYRDFQFEYPPLALVPMIIPRLLGGGANMGNSAYIWMFVAENIVLGMLVSLAVKRIARQLDPRSTGLAAMACFSAMLVLGALLVPFRFDLFAALLTVLALDYALAHCPNKAGLFIGLGIATKLYPLGLGAILALHYLASKGRGVAIRFGIAAMAALGVVVGTFMILTSGHLLDFVRYHQARGLHLESVQGGIVCLLHCLGITPAASVTNFGASHLVSHAASALLNWQAVLSGAAMWTFFLICWIRSSGDARKSWSDEESSRQIVRDLAGVLVLFMIVSKVFSPQYMLWVMPLVVLLPGRAVVVFLLAWIVTLVIFPFEYEQLKAMSTGAILLLNIRNALMIWLFAVLNTKAGAGVTPDLSLTCKHKIANIMA